MRRAIQLATIAGKYTKSNPRVGAVIVHDTRIIGEGYHSLYGGPHAEVEAIRDVHQHGNSSLLSTSTLYVTLEPCNHHGKTPPCIDLILKHRIPKVVIGCLDPSPHIAGASVSRMQDKGVTVIEGILEKNCKDLLRPFLRHSKQMPYTYIKMAQSQNRIMGDSQRQVWFTGQLSKAWSHHWRDKVDAIMIGTGTATMDNPQLDVRLVEGSSPLRVVLDRQARVPKDHKILSDGNPTRVYTCATDYIDTSDAVTTVQIPEGEWSLRKIWHDLFLAGVYHLLVEGGKSLIESLAEANLWEEAIVLTNQNSSIADIKAADLQGRLTDTYPLQGDTCHHFLRVT